MNVPFRLKKINKSRILTGVFYFQEKPSASQKVKNFKFGFKNAQLATQHTKNDCVRTLLLVVTVASQSQVLDHRD